MRPVIHPIEELVLRKGVTQLSTLFVLFPLMPDLTVLLARPKRAARLTAAFEEFLHELLEHALIHDLNYFFVLLFPQRCFSLLSFFGGLPRCMLCRLA